MTGKKTDTTHPQPLPLKKTMTEALEKKLRSFFLVHDGASFFFGCEVYTTAEALEACLTYAEDDIEQIQERYEEHHGEKLPYEEAEALFFDRLESEAWYKEPGDDC